MILRNVLSRDARPAGFHDLAADMPGLLATECHHPPIGAAQGVDTADGAELQADLMNAMPILGGSLALQTRQRRVQLVVEGEFGVIPSGSLGFVDLGP